MENINYYHKFLWVTILCCLLGQGIAWGQTLRAYPENTWVYRYTGAYNIRIRVNSQPTSSNRLDFTVGKQSGTFTQSGTCRIRRGSTSGTTVGTYYYSAGTYSFTVPSVPVYASDGTKERYFAVIGSYNAGPINVYGRLSSPSVYSPSVNGS